MTVEIDTLQKQLAELKAENEKLNASLRDGDKAKLEAEVESLKKQLVQATEASVKFAEADKSTLAMLTQTKANLEETEKSLKAISDELGAIKSEQKKVARLTAIKAALKVKDEDEKAVASATKLSESLFSLSDEQFDANISALVLAGVNMMTSAPPTNNPQSGNTSFPAGPAKQAPKATSAPHGPKATSAPAPMAGKMVSSAKETDAAEANADTAILDNVETKPEASLATETDAGAESLRSSIASFFGYSEDVTETK